jgi:hypothetical protein
MTSLEAEAIMYVAFMLASVIYIAGVVISWNKE